MDITNINLDACPLQYLSIGYVGETGARPVSFDSSAWAAEYGAGVLQLLLLRPGDAEPYPVLLDIDGTTATWTPDATDTAAQGQGQAQLIYTVGGVIVKNAIFRVLIAPSLGAAGEPPEPYETWLQRLTELAAETQQSALDAAGSAEAAGTSAGAAAGSAGAAAQSALDAEAAKSGAETAETTAGQSAALAGEKAAQAAQSAQTAAQKATDAQQSAEDAQTAATAAGTSADNAEAAAGGANQAKADAQRAASAAAASASAAAGSAADAASAVTEVETKGAEQITAINQAGTTQIAAVDAAGAAQVQAIEEKGEEVLESIPEDYSDLSADVVDLKSSLNGGTSTYTKTYMWNNRYSTNRIYNAEKYNIGRKLTDIFAGQTTNAFSYMVDCTLSKTVSFPTGTQQSTSIYGCLAFDKNDVCVWTRRFTGGDVAGNVITVTLPDDAVKFLFTAGSSLNSLGTEYVVTVISDSLKNSIIYSNVDDFRKLQTVRTNMISGFVNIDGNIEAATDAVQLTTDFIPVYNGDTFRLSVSYPASNTMWAAYACYDSAQNFISPRVILINHLQTDGYIEFAVTNENAKFIRVSYNSYGTATATLYCANNTDVLYALSSDLKAFDALQHGYINNNIRDIGHRGYSSAPENTLPAFVLARKKGYAEVETDIRFTSDGVAVLLHDAEINRTARNADGSTLSSTINIADITYEQALTYDFGVYKGSQFAGTKIPTLTEFLTLCKKIGLFCWLELKAGTSAQIYGLVDTVFNYGMADHVAWTSAAKTYLTAVKEHDETAELCLAFQGTYPASALENLKTGKNVVTGSVNVAGGNLASIVSSAQADRIPLYFWTILTSTQLNNVFDAYAAGYFSEMSTPPSYWLSYKGLNN